MRAEAFMRPQPPKLMDMAWQALQIDAKQPSIVVSVSDLVGQELDS
jgi:hypothetical protein